MNTRTIHKIAFSLILGGTLSVTSNSIMAAPPVPGIAISQIPLSTGATGVTPNIMLMLDNSGSMGTDFTSTSPAISINDTLPSGYSYNCTSPRSGGATTAALATTTTFMRIVSPPTIRFCTSNISCGNSSPTFSTTNCFDNTKYYKISNYTGSGTTGTSFGTYLGLNLNWYFSTGNFNSGSLTAVATTTTQSRMEVAQNAATGLVNSLTPATGEKPTVRLGLTTYHYDSNNNNKADGGELLVPMGDLTSDTSTAGQASKVNTAINDLSPTGNTPLATTLSDIGRYFTTGYAGNLILHPGVTNTSDSIANIFNNHNITNAGTTPPIQSYCQKSAVILVSDGLPNDDRAISAMLRDYTGDCATTKIPRVCDATPNSLSLPGAGGVALNATGTTCQSTSAVRDRYGNIITPAIPNDWYNIACQNGTKAGRKYETRGSDYLDDVAVALYEMDLRPTWTGITKPAGSKNNLKTYAIGIADPSLQADSVLRDAALRGGGTFEYADNANKLIAALDKMVADIKKGVGSFSALAANSTQLKAGTALFQAKYDTNDWTGDFLALPLSLNEDTNGNGTLDTNLGEDTNGNGVLDTGGDILNPVWNAGTNIPAFQSRNIYTYNSGATPKGVAFRTLTAVQICANLTAAQRTALGIASCVSTDAGVWLLDYVRGDISHEQVNTLHAAAYNNTSVTPATGPDPRASNTSQIFRNRARFYGADAVAPKKEGDLMTPDPWLLGDIVNSDTLYVSNESYGYATAAGLSSAESSTYKAFVTGKSSWRKMAYIGANDGLLHGFDARIPATGTTDPEAGKEILAYMPNTIFNRLKSLAAPDYSHLYFVDGSPRAHDVYFGSAWHTVLVGTTGAGGKGVFALDVTDPATFNTSDVLWELSDIDSPIASDRTTDTTTFRGFQNNLGYTLPQPSIGKMHDGSWAAIVANGYASNNNLGVLYIINIQTGAIIAALDTKSSSAGLSTPFVVDVDRDGVIDSVYAGDLIGNMWKFDVSSSTSSQWKVAYGTTAAPAPVFIACLDATSTATCDASRQPITNKPQVGGVGTGQGGGVMVYFGTGKYFEDADNNIANTATQSFYGIWDECPLANSTPTPTTTCSTVAKSSLVSQSILKQDTVCFDANDSIVDCTQTTVVTKNNVRATSNTSVSYPTKKGWYMDFVNVNSTTTPKANDGERIVSASLLRSGRIIFTTLIPIPPTTTTDPNALCTAGSTSTSWLMELDALSGSRLSTPVLDISGNGLVTSKDVFTLNGSSTTAPASGTQIEGGSETPVVENDGKNEKKCLNNQTSTKLKKCIAEKGSSSSDTGAGRQSWRQL